MVTIDLHAYAALTEFLGYDQPPTNTPSAEAQLPIILPGFCVQHAGAGLKLYDGQTVVLGRLTQHFLVGEKEVGTEPDHLVKTQKHLGQAAEMDQELLVFITASIVDPAGNRVHSDQDLALVQNDIPAQ